MSVISNVIAAKRSIVYVCVYFNVLYNWAFLCTLKKLGDIYSISFPNSGWIYWILQWWHWLMRQTHRSDQTLDSNGCQIVICARGKDGIQLETLYKLVWLASRYLKFKCCSVPWLIDILQIVLKSHYNLSYYKKKYNRYRCKFICAFV